MWTLHSLGTAYASRPSAILEIYDDPWAAYQIDLAALVIGRAIENETRDGKKSVPEVLREMKARQRKGRAGAFRDPRAYASRGRHYRFRKMQIPENGVW